MKQKILLVDDEVSIVTLIKYNIERAGYNTEVAYSGNDALEKAINYEYDLIILDIMLPGIQGTEVCRQLRKRNIETPILMLTAKGSESDKITGLEVGADDYLTKPFSPKEMIARAKAILRRNNKTVVEEHTIRIANLTILPNHYEALIDDNKLELTRKEFDLLLHLSENQGMVLSREQLLRAVWNYDFDGDTRVVDVYISHLRKKIQPDANGHSFIHTIHGFGYKMGDDF